MTGKAEAIQFTAAGASTVGAQSEMTIDPPVQYAQPASLPGVLTATPIIWPPVSG